MANEHLMSHERSNRNNSDGAGNPPSSSQGVERDITDRRFMLPRTPVDVRQPFHVYCKREDDKIKRVRCDDADFNETIPARYVHDPWEIRKLYMDTRRHVGGYPREATAAEARQARRDGKIGLHDRRLPPASSSSSSSSSTDSSSASDGWAAWEAMNKTDRFFDRKSRRFYRGNERCDTGMHHHLTKRDDSDTESDPLVDSDEGRDVYDDDEMGWQADDERGMLWAGVCHHPVARRERR